MKTVGLPFSPEPGSEDPANEPVLPKRIGAVLLLVGLSAVLFWPVLFGGRTLFGRDVTPFFYPMKHVLRESVRAGQIPWWNPGVANGEPFFAALQPGVLYPGSLPLFLLPLSVAFDWLVVLHYPIAGAGLFFLLRRWGLSAPASWIGGASFMLGGYLVSIGNFPNNLQTVAWIPWLFWAWDRILERPSARRIAVFAGGCGVAFLGGEPQMLAIGLIWMFVHGLLRIENRPTNRLAQTRAFVVAGCLALALVAVQLVPFIEYVLNSVRVMPIGFEFASARSLEASGLVHFAIPPVIAAGPHTFTTQHLVTQNVPWILSPYPGVIVVALAATGLSASGKRRLLFWGGSALLGVLLAFGSDGALYRWLFEVLPGFRAFRYPEKFLLLPALAIPVLAAWGADSTTRQGGASRTLIIFAVAASVCGAASLTLSLLPDVLPAACERTLEPLRLCADAAESSRLYSRSTARLALLAALAAVIVARSRSRSFRPIALLGLLGALVAADLISAHAGVNPSVESRIYEEPGWVATVLREQGATPDAYRVRGTPYTAGMGSVVTVRGAEDLSNLYLDFQAMGPNVGQLQGFLHQDGLQGVELRSVAMTNDALLGQWAEDPVRFLRAMNVRWYSDATAAADSLVGLREIARHRELPLRLFEVPAPLARAYLTSRWDSVSGAARALQRTLDEDFSLGSRVVLEESPAGVAPGATGRIAEASFEQNRVILRTETDGPMVLVLNERYYPGWTARANGAEVPVMRASGIFQAVVVPTGDSRVEMRFRPTAILPAGIVSLAGLGILFALLLPRSLFNRRENGVAFTRPGSG